MDELEKLYAAVSQNFDIGSLEEFKAKMSTQEDRRRFYDVVSQRFDIGDYDSYEQRLGGVQEVSAQGSADTSQTSGQPSGNSAEPSSVDLEDKRSYDKYTDRTTYADVPEGYTNLQPRDLGGGVRGISATDPAELEVAKERILQTNPDAAAWDEDTLNAEAERYARTNVIPEVQITAKKADDSEAGFWNDVSLATQQIPDIFNQLIYSIPEYAYDLASRIPNILADAVENNAGEDLLGFIRTPTFQEFLGEITIETEAGDESNLNYLNPLYAINSVVQSAKQRQEYLGSQMQQFDQDILGNLTSGNFEAAGTQVVSQIIMSIPSMAAMAMTGGISRAGQLNSISRTALNALPFAASNYQEIQENPNLSQTGKLVVSGLHGLGEILTEQSFGTGKLIEDVATGAINERQFKEFATGYINRLLESNGIPAVMFRGGVSEATTEAWNNVVAKYSGEDPDRDLNQGIMDAFIVGSAADGTFATANRVLRYATGADTENLYESTITELQALKQDLDNPNIPDRQRDAIQSTIVSKTSQLGQELDRVKGGIDNLSDTDRARLESNLTDLESLQQTIQDPNVSEVSKTALQQQAEQLSTEIDNLISETNAIQERETEAVPVGERAQDSQEVDGEIREQAEETEGQQEGQQEQIVEEAQATEPGQIFTRDIGGEQIVYRRNEDGTATIVPDAEAQQILSQQGETTVREEAQVGGVLSPSISIDRRGSRGGMISLSEALEYMGEDRAGSAEMTTSRQTIDRLKESISREGFKEPIVLMYDPDRQEASIIEGNHRLIAARELGIDEVPITIEKGTLRSDAQRVRDGLFPLNRVPVYGVGDVTRGVTAEQLGLETVRGASESDFKPAVQQTEASITPEQTESVNTTLEEIGFTPEESTSFLQDLSTEEGRAARKQAAADRIRQYWQSQQNLGIANQQNPEEFARFIRDVAEYAAVSILDGSIRTAKGLAKAIGVTYDENIKQAFEQAQAIVQPIQEATVTPPRTTTRGQIRRATEGGIQGTEVVEINSRKALRDQIRMAEINARAGEALGIRNTKANQKQYADKVKEYKDVIRGYIKSFNKTELFKGATVPANLVARLTDRLGKIQDTSPTAINQLMNFSEYLEKLVDDIEYDNKAAQARKESKRIASIAKGLKQQRDLQGTLQRFANLGANPIRISDLDRYNELAAQAIDRKGNIGVSILDLNAFVNEQETKYEAEQVRKQEAANEVRRQQALAHMQEIMDAEGIEGNAEDFYDESTLEYRPEGVPSDLPDKPETSKAKEQLEQMVAFNRQGLPRTLDGLNSYEAESLEAMRGIPLDDLDVATLRKLNTIITNAVVNGDFISGTSEIVGRYKAGRDAETWLTQFNDQMHNIVRGTSERWTSNLPSKLKLDTNQLFRSIAGKAQEVGRELYDKVMGDVEVGFTRAKKFVDKSVSSALRIYDKNKLKSRGSFRVGTALFLLNYETDGMWDNPQQAFDTKINLIALSRNALQEALETQRHDMHDVDANIYRRHLNNLNDILAELDNISTPEQFSETFLTPQERELYDHILSVWESQKENTRELYKKVGVKFTESELYAPTSWSSLTTVGVNLSEDIDIDTFNRPGDIAREGKHVAARRGVTTLPTTKADDGTVVTRYLNLDAIRNFDRELSRRMYDMETLDGRIKAKYLLANNDVKNAVDGGDKRLGNHAVLVWKTKQNIRDLSGISGFVKDLNQDLDSIIAKATRLFYRSTVGSVTQLTTQSVTNVGAIMANTSIPAWARSVKLMGLSAIGGERLVSDLIEASSASAYNRLSSSIDDKMMNSMTRMENEADSNFKRALNKADDFVADATYAALGKGDDLNTKNAWLAGYVESLKKQGVIKKTSEFTVDMLKEHIANPNRWAALAADDIAGRINATMRKASRAETTKMRNTSQKVLNYLIGFPLKSFSTSQNMEARLAFNNILRMDFTGKDVGIIGGYLANVFILGSLLRYLWGLGFQSAGEVAASALLGGDDDEYKKAEERRLAELELTKEEEKAIKTNRKIWTMLAQATGNVLFGAKSVWVESIATTGIDIAYRKLIVPHFEKGKTAKDRARTEAPQSLYFTSADNVIGLGVADNVTQVFGSVEKLVTGEGKPIDEEAARKVDALRAINAVLSTGLAGADFKRFSQQTLIHLERAVKDGYYKMSKDYGVIKEAVNRYGIKPVAPFNKSKLYLADKDGNTEAVVLSEDDIAKINREVGKEMVNLLPKAGYGRNIDSFNKEGRSVDEMNSHMAKLKSVATPIVIQRLYGKAPISENRFNKIIEQEEQE